jgi:hypothetical protein
MLLGGCVAAAFIPAVVGVGGAEGANALSKSDQAKVLEKTADYFNTKPQNIKITSLDNSNYLTMGTDYKATYKGVTYNCTLVYGHVDCSRPGQGL